MSVVRRVLITGATSGLGREMARQLAAQGFRIAVTGRRAKELADTAELVSREGAECLPLAGTVADREQVRTHYAAIRERFGGLDWAILNAGVGESVDARDFRADVYERVFATNVLGVANWLEAVLPGMIAARSGLVAGISSVAGWRGLPGAGAYSASKAALSILLESTRVDLRGTGVEVVTVCPGFIRTRERAPGDDSGKFFLLDLRDGVQRILKGIERRKRLVHFPWQLSWPMRHVVRHLPDAGYDFLIGRVRRG
jgi:NAD(P)-dependent dehydrogenase (short-subunit alcohol dehydrogenase family)